MTSHLSINGKSACGGYGYLASHFECMKCRQIALDLLPDGPWEMWALVRENGNFHAVGSHFYSKMHSTKEEPIPVLVELDENGEYWGWQEYDSPDPSMIWDSEFSFNMCFGSGYKYLVEQKRGRAVRLKITRVSDEA